MTTNCQNCKVLSFHVKQNWSVRYSNFPLKSKSSFCCFNTSNDFSFSSFFTDKSSVFREWESTSLCKSTRVAVVLVLFLGDGGSFDLGFRGDFFVIIRLLRLTDLPLPSRIILRAASSLFFNPVNSTLFFLDGFFEYLSFAYSTSSFNLTNWLCGTIIVGKSLDDFLWLFSQCSH